MKTRIEVKDHDVFPGEKVVELYFGDLFIGALYGGDYPGVRVVSPHVTQGIKFGIVCSAFDEEGHCTLPGMAHLILPVESSEVRSPAFPLDLIPELLRYLKHASKEAISGWLERKPEPNPDNDSSYYSFSLEAEKLLKALKVSIDEGKRLTDKRIESMEGTGEVAARVHEHMSRFIEMRNADLEALTLGIFLQNIMLSQGKDFNLGNALAAFGSLSKALSEFHVVLLRACIESEFDATQEPTN